MANSNLVQEQSAKNILIRAEKKSLYAVPLTRWPYIFL